MAEKAPENEANYEPPTQRDYDGAPGRVVLHCGKKVKLHDIQSILNLLDFHGCLNIKCTLLNVDSKNINQSCRNNVTQKTL